MEKFFPAKTAVTSSAVRTEIARAETEIASLHAKLNGAMAGVAAMTDASPRLPEFMMQRKDLHQRGTGQYR